MDYKEKYEMALEGIQEILGSGEDSIKMSRLQQRLQGIFPELKESEDEKIRQFLIHEVTETSDEIMSYRNMNKKDVLAWLEKQGEKGTNGNDREIPNSAWNEEDELRMENILSVIEGHGYPMEVEWIKSIKDRIHPNQEWSEDDEMMIKFALTHFRLEGATEDSDIIKWLKSLRPQKQWKPTEGQMGVIEAVINNRSFQRRHLDSLYEQLKKLI